MKRIQFKQFADRLIRHPGATTAGKPISRKRPLQWTGLESLEDRVMLSADPINVGAAVAAAVIKGKTITVSDVVTDSSTATIKSVEFVLDVNANNPGSISSGDVILGYGRLSTTVTNTWEIHANTGISQFKVGDNNEILVIATDTAGNKASNDMGTVTVEDTPPVVTNLVAPKHVASGNAFELIAEGIYDRYTPVTSVQFAIDGVALTNLTHADLTHIGTTWSIRVNAQVLADNGITLPTPTTSGPAATVTFTAVATDKLGTIGVTYASTSSKVLAPPTAGMLTADPSSAAIGSKVTLSLSSATAVAPGAKIAYVAFWYNPGDSTTIGSDSIFLGYGYHDRATGAWILISKVGKRESLGDDTILAYAVDSNGFHSAAATATLDVLPAVVS